MARSVQEPANLSNENGTSAGSASETTPGQGHKAKALHSPKERKQSLAEYSPGVTTKKKAKGAKGHSGSSHAGPRSLGLRLEIGWPAGFWLLP